MIKHLILIIISVFLLSCRNRQTEKEISYTLLFNADSSSIAKPFFRDSILVTNYGEDSIIIKNYFDTSYYQNNYFNHNNNYFEKRYVSNFPDQIFEIDTILTFSHEAVSFIYQSRRDNFIVNLIDLSLFDGKYITDKEGNNYKTIKQSLIDTSYKEIFFYDKDYKIYKFINTWKNNKSVYLRKD